MQASIGAASFRSGDLKDTATLTLTPVNGFSGKVQVGIQTNIVEPSGFAQIPNTVTVTVPGSPVTVAGAATNTSINFAWTAWPAGSYEANAVLTSSGTSSTIPIVVTISAGVATPSAVVTWHNDNMRTGNYSAETILTPANVATATFGKLFSHQTVGQIEAEPLYVPSVNVAGKAHNVVFVATLNAMVYAFDADNASGANANPLWTANCGPASPAGTGGGGDTFEQGIASTPVIDTNTGTMYVVSKNGSGNAAVFKLHALDITSGHEKLGGPVTISASVSGVQGGVNGTIILASPEQYQRCALLELNGTIYIGIGGLYGDTAPCRGWILGYNAASLAQTCVYTTAPDDGTGSQTAFAGASIWMSGGGIVSDGTYLYASTGNGDFDATAPGNDYGDSVIKLQPFGATLKVVDYFTPHDQLNDENADLDVGSGAPMLIPNGGTPYLVQPSKSGFVYIVNTKSMGGFDFNGDQDVQETNPAGSGFWSSAAYFNGRVYLAPESASLYCYTIGVKGLGSLIGTSAENFFHATPTVSSNGVTNGIVWIVEGTSPATLCAYNALTMSLLYSSGARDAAGTFIKFCVPAVANGKVYVPCADGLYVYGNGSFGAVKRSLGGGGVSKVTHASHK